MDCYVYVHRKKTDGKIFYIGKGRNKRAWKKTQRSDWWKRVEAKHGRDVEIVLSGLTDEDAFQLERELIDWMGLDNLCNLRGGGDGGFLMSPEVREKISSSHKGKVVSLATREKMRAASTGRVVSDETKAKLRAARLKQVMPPVSDENRKAMADRMRGRFVSDETRAKISAAKKGVKTGRRMSDSQKEKLRIANKGRTISESHKEVLRALSTGRKHSPDALERITESNRRLNKERRKPILCSNGMKFSFSGEAQDWLRENGKPSAMKTNIVSCCTGRLKSAYGFTWSFDTLQVSD